MKLKTINFDHSEEGFHAAIGADENLTIRCRERIFFTHFANTLQANELFKDRDSSPREMTTVTGDLQRCIQAISDPLEYEIVLLNFMAYHNLATQAYAHYHFINDPENSSEDKLKLELMKMVSKLKKMGENNGDDDKSDDISLDTVTNRIDVVKKSQYNFSRYMELMGYANKNYDEVDQMINGLFN